MHSKRNKDEQLLITKLAVPQSIIEHSCNTFLGVQQNDYSFDLHGFGITTHNNSIWGRSRT